MSINYAEKPIIEMKDIVKDFPGVRALAGITFDVYKGGNTLPDWRKRLWKIHFDEDFIRRIYAYCRNHNH